MSFRKVRCIFGCDTFGVSMHGFPNKNKYPAIFQAWVSVIPENIIAHEDPAKGLKSLKVCDYHFKPEHRTRGHGLTKTAIPCLYLEGVPKAITELDTEHNYCLPRMKLAISSANVEMTASSSSCVTLDTGIASTSHVQTPVEACVSPIVPHIEKEPKMQTSLCKGIASTSTSDVSVQTSVEAIVLHNEEEPSKLQTSLSKGKTNVTQIRTEENKEYQRQITNLKKMVTRMKKKEESFKTRLARAEKIARSSFKITSNMSQAARIFTGLQYRESAKSSRGRRFTEEEKVLSLSLLKRSPKSYSLLSKYFCLPSKKTLLNVLKAVKLVPGINKIIFEKLKDTVSKMNAEDRLCSLIFDEMSITPQVHYDKSRDEIIGFENLGTYKTHKFADHVTVFMIKGLRKNFKQPVAYYFSQNMRSVDLKNIVINVIKNIQSTGLQVLVTVCDQSGINTATINNLLTDAKQQYLRKGQNLKNDVFFVDGKQIIPLYDVPHLLKGLRNNLLTKDLIFVDPLSKEEVTVKWEYFKMLYEADKCYGELRLMYKLTEEHVLPEKINKMRVKPAAQLFSHSVAVGIKHLSARDDVPKEMEKIIPLIQIIDKLFDSLNCGTFNIKNGKIYTGAVKKNSPHHKLWDDAKRFLNSVRYVNRVNKVEKQVPSIKNWIKTIEGYQLLWKTLNEKYSQDCFLTRNCNQDPLENFFGNVRSMGARNVSPNCIGFEGAYKTLLLNNFNAHHSPRANCEEDTNSSLQSLQFFIKEKDKIQEEPIKYTNVYIGEPHELFTIDTTTTPGISQRNYVCGWALTKVLKLVKGCKKCKLSLCGSSDEPGNEFIKLREYNLDKTWLSYPSQNLSVSFTQIQTVVSNFLTHDVHLPGLKERIKSLVEIASEFSYLNCNKHKEIVIKCFTDVTINVLVYSWCKSVNRILAGKCNYDGDDQIKLAARAYFLKHKTKPKK